MNLTVDFKAPWMLALLLAVPVMLWVARHRPRGVPDRQRRVALALRGVVFCLIILALSEPRLGRPDDRLSLVIAVDTSDSVSESGRLLQVEWVRQALQAARADDRVNVIEFGRWAARAEATVDAPAGDATNLADALLLGESMLLEGGKRRIVLLSDGHENLGQAQEASARLARRGIEVYFVRPEPPVQPPDVLLKSLGAPTYLRDGETLQADALVASSHAVQATVRLFTDEQLVAEQIVDLQAGEQHVSLVARLSGLGFRALRAEVQAANDSVRVNNSAEAFTIVKESGRVLVLESRPGEAEQLDAVLRESGLRTEVRPTSAVPPSAAPLQVYDSVVLLNVPSTALTLDQQTTLQSYVEEYGKGLVVVGGHTSYSMGAYVNTPLGELLPVDPTPPARRERGSLALILVIDKSGSMDLYRQDVSKMAMAREAASQAVDLLQPDDVVGVVAFDTRFQWVVPPARINDPSDLRSVKQRIASIPADGGTSIFPALEAAYQAAAGLPTRLKHIVLLTDGQSPDGDYAGMIARMKPRNITLTAVGIGSDTDQTLLTRLARLGDGRYYFTERPQEVPRIATRESTIISRNAIVEGQVQPRVAEPSPLLADLHGVEVPPLSGYVATTARESAHTILTSERGDPLLASWQQGLGRVIAWTSDARPEWASAWLDSAPARRVWGQAVRWSMPRPIDPSFQLSADVQDETVTLRVQALERDGRFAERREIRATVTTPAGRALEVPLRQVGPGTYEVEAQPPGPGVYRVQAEQLTFGAPARSELGGFVVSEAEPRTIGASANRPLLELLADSTGGREVLDPREAFVRDPTWLATAWTPIWPWLLGLGLVLLPLDILLRRLRLGR